MEQIANWLIKYWHYLAWIFIFCVVIWKGIRLEFRLGDNVVLKWTTNSLQKQIKELKEQGKL